jgi:hypothetical protein
MLTEEQKETIETLFLGKVLAKEEDLAFFKSHFKYLGPLGQGAFAIVVAAKWSIKGRETLVAVKCFCKEDFEANIIEQFRKEGKITHGQQNDYLLSNLDVK